MSLLWGPSLRRRVVGSLVGLVAVVLGTYAVGVLMVVRGSLRAALDAQLHQDFELVEQLLTRGADGSVAWRLPPHQDAEVPRTIEIWDGPRVAVREDRLGVTTGWPSPPEDVTGYVYASQPPVSGAAWRSVTGVHAVEGGDVTIRVARPQTAVRDEVRQLGWILVVGWPLALTFAGLGGSLVVRRALSPLDDMAQRARTISADRLDERFVVHNPSDELGKLAVAFNDGFARLDEAFGRLRRFTSDASHELRTPLTAIRTVGEVTLRERRDEATYRDTIGSMLEEADRLARLTDTLLAMSRTDGRSSAMQRTPVALDDLVREIADLLTVLAEERQQRIVVEAVERVEVLAEPSLVRSAVLNLVDNAIKHGQAGCEIRITVATDRHVATVSVSDRGPRIADAHREQVFERFFRVDHMAGQSVGGLGLSIAQWAVEANGGRLELMRLDGDGNTFRIVLPTGTDQSQVARAVTVAHEA